MTFEPDQVLAIFAFVICLMAITFTFQIICRVNQIVSGLPTRGLRDYLEALRVALLPDDNISSPSGWHF